jgi:putative NADPH-quinone reductase
MVVSYLMMQMNRLTGGVVPPPRTYGSAPPGGWNVLLIQAHPLPNSFSAYLARTVRDSLQGAGHRVQVIDLYTCDKGRPLNPLLTVQERERYFEGTPPSPYPAPSSDVAPFVQALRSADALVFVYPTWWMGVPAILKGFVDRVFLPGVSFRIPGVDGAPGNQGGGLIPGLPNIKKVGVVTTYGAPRHIVAAAGDLGHGLIARALLPLFHAECTIRWQGLYSMDTQTAKARADFVGEVREIYSHNFIPEPASPGAGRGGSAPVVSSAA